MKLDGNQWESDIIEDLFDDRDKNLTYNIQLNPNKPKDTWYWMFELKGTYSVKSGYKEIKSMHVKWEENDASSIWQKLWKLKIPTKVKTFLWRTLTNCLPTRVNL